MQDSNTKTIEVDADVYERFEERRQGTKNEHVPAMSESAFLSSLLDTAEAVDRGHYEDSEQTPQDVWEEHNEPFSYDPPEKPADAWSSEEYQELIDRVISRQVQWFCDKCSGRGPIRSLQKARSHVESQHSQDLVEQHATPREELETATDGGESDAERRGENNQSLTEWSE